MREGKEKWLVGVRIGKQTEDEAALVRIEPPLDQAGNNHNKIFRCQYVICRIIIIIIIIIVVVVVIKRARQCKAGSE